MCQDGISCLTCSLKTKLPVQFNIMHTLYHPSFLSVSINRYTQVNLALRCKRWPSKRLETCSHSWLHNLTFYTSDTTNKKHAAVTWFDRTSAQIFHPTADTTTNVCGSYQWVYVCCLHARHLHRPRCLVGLWSDSVAAASSSLLWHPNQGRTRPKRDRSMKPSMCCHQTALCISQFVLQVKLYFITNISLKLLHKASAKRTLV